jgi:ribosomal protein S27E
MREYHVTKKVEVQVYIILLVRFECFEYGMECKNTTIVFSKPNDLSESTTS